MPTINQLPTTTQLSGGDQFPVYLPNTGDARRVSYTTIKDDIVQSITTDFDVTPGAFQNKTFNLGSNNILTGTLAQFNAACSDDNFVGQSVLAASSGSSLVGFIQAGAGAVARSAQDKMRERRTVRDYGAATDGVTNARPAFVLADAVGPLIVSEGNYLISTSITIANDVTFEPGGVLVIPNGVTVTFTGYVSAGVDQIFSCTGTGAVVVNPAKTREGYSEWWGAVANDAGAASVNTNAINAALVALRKVDLMAADYFVSGTIIMETPNTVLSGVDARYDTVYGPKATRLLVTSATDATLRIGPTANPGGIANFSRGFVVRDLYVARTIAPDITASSPGVVVKYCISSEIERVQSAESIITMQFVGTVGLRVIDCDVTRAAAGTGAGTDFWRGYYIDGISDVIAAGGNASIFMVRCTASCNIASLQTATGTAGYYIDGAFSDIFLRDPETTNCYNGIVVVGNNSAVLNFNNVDLHIDHAICDQFRNAGIYLVNIAKSGSVEVVEPYLGPHATARASLWFSNCSGGGTLRGGQFVQGGSTAQAIIIDTCDGVIIDRPLILEAANTYPVVGIVAINNCDIRPRISNFFNTAAAAIQLNGTCIGNIFQPIVMGKASAFTFGIQVLGTSDARNEYNCTGIDSAAISGGAANKLVRNGVSITAAFTLTDTNTTSGVMT